MTLELAIATMNKTIDGVLKMLGDENIHCNCIVVNQCGVNEIVIKELGNFRVRIICTTERGLSKSRNMAIRNAESDILLIGDDDEIYYDGFEKAIITAYESNPKVEVGIFNIDTYDRVFYVTERNISYPFISHFTSQQISFKVAAIKEKNIEFNEKFGAGSGFVQFGEENVFLSECYKKKLKFRYFPQKILLNENRGVSSWFKGMNNEAYLRDKGVVYYAIYGNFCIPYILRFIFKHREQIKPYRVFEAFKIIIRGKKFYKSLEESKKKKC